jgi:hypothetical protein
MWYKYYLYAPQSSANVPEIGCIYECLVRLYTFKNNQKKITNYQKLFGLLSPSQKDIFHKMLFIVADFEKF